VLAIIGWIVTLAALALGYGATVAAVAHALFEGA
jgi:hypothetical protein